MASVFKIPRSPYWFAAFRGAHNERCQRTTKRRKRSEANAIALQWERAATLGRSGALTEATCRKVLGEILEITTGEQLHFKTAQAWFEEWVAGKKGATADKTIEKYEQVTRDFLKHLGPRAKLTLAAITPQDVRSFRDALAKGGRSASTVNQIVRKVLATPFTAAMRLGYITVHPCAGIDALLDDSEGERDTFTPEQIRKLIEAAESDWKGAILCGYFTGLRLRDVAELKWEAVDFEAGVLRIKPRKARKNGKNKEILLPLHEEFTTWLKKQRRGIGKAPIFPELCGKGTGGRNGLSGLFKAVMERAGIVARVVRSRKGAGRQTTSLSFHSLRHSFVSALANAGVAAEVRQKLSGHADDQSHARYTHHEMETLRTAMAKLPGIGGAR